MRSLRNDGLFGSLMIYVSAIAGALVLLGIPVWYALQPTVIENVSAERVHELLSARRTDGAFPVARLATPDFIEAVPVTEHARVKEKAEEKARVAAQAERVRERMRADAVQERKARLAERAARSREVYQARAEAIGFARPAPPVPSAAAY